MKTLKIIMLALIVSISVKAQTATAKDIVEKAACPTHQCVVDYLKGIGYKAGVALGSQSVYTYTTVVANDDINYLSSFMLEMQDKRTVLAITTYNTALYIKLMNEFKDLGFAPSAQMEGATEINFHTAKYPQHSLILKEVKSSAGTTAYVFSVRYDK